MHLFIQAVILGIVEGVTEFLPVSSTGHLILVNKFIEFTGTFANMFDIVIQLGAILAVIIYFWKRIWPFDRSIGVEAQKNVRNLWLKTIAGVLPALAIGGTLGKKVEEHLFNPWVVAGALAVGGVVLILVDRRNREPKISNIASLTYGTAIAIGLIQCLAMIPGTSRSAATIIGAMLLGCSRLVAVEFSFFLAIPTLAAASAYSLLKSGFSLSPIQWQALGIGFAVSFVVAWAVIALFMNYIRTKNFVPFGWYRIVLAIGVVIWMVVKG